MSAAPQEAAVAQPLPWRPQPNIAIWRRDLAPCLLLAARDLAATAASGAGFWVDNADRPALHRSTALSAFDAANWPSRPGLDLLAADIAMLLAWFRRRSKATRLHVSLMPVRSHACRFYHTDKVGLRLLCSYAGPGTEWLPDVAVTRAALGKGDNAAVLADPGQRQQLQTGWTAILRGERDSAWHGRGVVHRSPPHHPGQDRLVLTIDEPGPHLEG